MLIAGIAVAGAVGAPMRYVLDRAVHERRATLFPLGTLLVNVLGSFVLGALTGLALYHAFSATPKIILGTGFCGAFTTYSTFTHDTVRLLEARDFAVALQNVVLMTLLPAAFAAAGLALASR